MFVCPSVTRPNTAVRNPGYTPLMRVTVVGFVEASAAAEDSSSPSLR